MKKQKAIALFSFIAVVSACGFPYVDNQIGLELGPITRSGLFQISAPLRVVNPFNFKLCVPPSYQESVDLTLTRLSDGAQALPQDLYPGDENPILIGHYFGNPMITRPVFILAPGESFETTAQVDLRYLEGGIHIYSNRFNQQPTPNGVYGFETSIAVYKCSAVNYESVDSQYQINAPINSQIGVGFLSSTVSEGLYIDFDAIRATFNPEALALRNSRIYP